MYSQRDQRWANVRIGNTKLTVGRWGCTLTNVAMLLSISGVKMTPGQLARVPGLFNQYGEIIWSNIEKIPGSKLKWDGRRFGRRGRPVRNNKAISESINGSPNTFVLLEVAWGSHWVLGYSVYGSDYMVIDPIDGKKKLAVKSFNNISGSSHLIRFK